MDTKATINLPLSEYMDLQKQVGEREHRIAQLEKDLKEAELRDPQGRVDVLVTALKSAAKVVAWASGNLAPETVRGWPYEALEQFGNCLANIPGGNQDLIELGRDLVTMSREIKPFEVARANGMTAPARVGGPG